MSLTLAGVAPPTSNPVNLASVISVSVVVTKSSAVSVSSFPVLAVRDSVAIRPSGFPVLKKNGVGAAAAGSEMVAHSKAATAGIAAIEWFMLFPLLQVVETKG